MMGWGKRTAAPSPVDPESEMKEFRVDGFNIPVKIIREKRANSRVAFGRQQVVIRLSRYLNASDQESQLELFYQWIRKQISRKPDHYERFRVKVYHEGQRLRVSNRTYTLHFQKEAGRRTITGKLYPDVHRIDFQVPDRATDEMVAPHVEQLLSRLVAAHHLPEVTQRVRELNARHFGRPVGKVSLKYNHSNWGSCSAKGNINLSTRLLFAPPEVLDYVIIHELAHLIELNHSPRFWAQVARAMPDYPRHEQWLKEHGAGMNY